jgi:hypothetical protein
MPSAARDRTARTRIRDYLAERGAIVDPSGRATSVLKDAIGYEGSAVAFIQLVTAMDKNSELVREIRGKRTYRISSPASVAPAVAPPRAPSASAQSTPPARPTPSPLPERAGAGAQLEVNYDELARALLRETWRLAEASASQDTRELEAARQERDQLIVERDEYARRLQQLSVLINGLAPAGDSPDAGDSPSRRLIAELTQGEVPDRRRRAG